jgi:hypothetical protein
MRKALLLTFALMLVAGMAFGEPGRIGIFSDPTGGNNCNLTDSPAGTKNFYVVHIDATSVSGSQFLAKVPDCFTGTFSKDTYPAGFLNIGTSQIGLSVVYDPYCSNSPVLLVTIELNVLGTTPACCVWRVTADPAVSSGEIEVADCEYNVLFATGYHALFNTDTTCNCSIPTEDTTWGQVKALYE